MYHELLLTLVGYTGDVFPYDGHFFTIAEDLNLKELLFHSSERHLLDGILEVATYYKRLNEFIEHQSNLGITETLKIIKGPYIADGPSVCDANLTTPVKQKQNWLVGLYVNAFCHGVRQILDEYQELIGVLEGEILCNETSGPYTTLTDIRAKIEPFRIVFQNLDSIMLKLKTQSKSSVLIVELVKSEYDHNVHIQESLGKITPCVNKIMYNQIINWIVYGAVHDPFSEFFIKPVKVQSGSVSSSMNTSKLESSTSRSPSSTNKYTSQKPESYYIDYGLVPSHFPINIVDRIFHIGNSIGILNKSKKTRSSILRKQEDFYFKLEQLPLDTFRTEDLSSVISELSNTVGKDLHHLVVTETDLPKHLGIIKDFYLTGRGELFHDFLVNLKTMPMVKSSILSDVKRTFALSATRVQVQDDILQRIVVQLPSEVMNNPSMNSVMANIHLGMEDEWPLHILFTPQVVSRYNEMFRFLLQVRLLQLELNRIWIDTRKIFRFPVPQGPAELRNVMSFFIDHLQHYLHEDVLENQFTILSCAVEKSENFDQILLAHTQFQSNILSQSFRTSKQLRHFLDEILKICKNYVSFITTHISTCEAKNLPVNEGISTEVSGFSMDFKRHMDLLLNLLKNLAMNPTSGQFLGQFLLRLDFNSYFSSIIPGFTVQT